VVFVLPGTAEEEDEEEEEEAVVEGQVLAGASVCFTSTEDACLDEAPWLFVFGGTGVVFLDVRSVLFDRRHSADAVIFAMGVVVIGI
jgi:hypothetical protein